MTTPGNYRKINFDRCDHKVLGTCDEETDGCCAVVACDLCLQLFDAELSPEQREFATPIDSVRISWDGTGYRGSLRNVVFESMWQRGYDGKCRFIVDIDDGFGYPQTLAFFKCETDAEAEYGGESASCMFPSGEATVTVPLEGAPKALVLVWSPLDIVTLRHRKEPGIECNFPACGDCTCSTRELCLELTSSDGCVESKIVNFLANPECPLQELPEWDYEFTCGYDVVTGSLRLEHNDETGQCELIHEVPAEYVEQVVVLEECKTIEEEFSWIVGEGDDAITYTLKVRDADCDTCDPVWGVCYCGPDNIVETIKVSIFSGLTGLTPLGTIIMRRALIPVPGCPNSTLAFPVPCQGFYGSATMMFPIGMGEFEENTLELRLYCATDCSSCFERRFGSGFGGFNDGRKGWRREPIQFEFLVCEPTFSAVIEASGSCQGYEENYTWKQPPTPADAQCYDNTEYQIQNYLLEQLTP
jgi:hypothetical protein